VTNLPEVQRLQAVAVQPGDVIVATVPAATAPETAERVENVLLALFPDNKVLVLTDNVDLGVYRPEDVERSR
jgi:predicted dinucleotide-binding enzyme